MSLAKDVLDAADKLAEAAARAAFDSALTYASGGRLKRVRYFYRAELTELAQALEAYDVARRALAALPEKEDLEEKEEPGR